MPDFKDIILKIEESGKPYSITVRDLMKSVGHYRRDTNVNHDIRTRLSRSKLTTDPEFELLNIDSKVKVLSLGSKKPAKGVAKKAVVQPEQQAGSREMPPALSEDLEVFRTIGQLPSAVRVPITIARGEKINRAVTLMLQEGVDHLVVAQSKRRIEGVVTWASIGRAGASRRGIVKVADCMEKEPYIVPYDTPLFDAVREITRRGIALVLSQNKNLAGSVTTVDIADQFVALSEPFLFLEQIENNLRSLLRSAKLSGDSIKGLVNSSDQARKDRTKSVSDLSFGEILRAFENAEIWDKINLNLDRKLVVERLKEVNEIRNRVMHFHPDGISDEDRGLLQRIRLMLQIL